MESKVVPLLSLSAHLHANAVRLCEFLSLSHTPCFYFSLVLSRTDWNKNMGFGHHCNDQV